MNRPVRDMTSAQLIAGLREFCNEYRGAVWIETFIIDGINDSLEELEHLRATLATMRHDRVQLNTLDRPGAVSWIAPVATERLENIATFLGEGVEVVATRRALHRTQPGNENARELLLATIQVRPCTREDLQLVTGLIKDDLEAMLRELSDSGRVETRTVDGVDFLLASERVNA